MKKFIAGILFCSLLMVSGSAKANNLKVGLPSNISKEEINQILPKVAGALAPGQSAIFFDAYSGNTIEGTEFKIPNRDKFIGDVKRKMRANRKAHAKLLKFAKIETPDGSMLKLRVPQFVRQMAELYPADDPTDLVLYGSLLYGEQDPFTMLHGHYPNDGMLVHGHHADTIFGTFKNEKLLENYRIHWIYKNAFVDDRHAFNVKRAFKLFFHLQSAEVVSMAPDLDAVFRRIGARPLKMAYELEDTDKQYMMRFVEPKKDDGKMKASIHTLPVEDTPMILSAAKRVEGLTVGVSWSTCLKGDIDIYARAHPAAVPLSFRNTTSNEGRFWRDYTKSPLESLGHETISFNNIAVDLTEILLFANVYRADCPGGVEGQVRISVDGQRAFVKNFSIVEATHGNSGAREELEELLRTRKAPSKYWIIFDVPDIVGLGSKKIAQK